MEPNLNIYQIAFRYVLMALFVGLGAAATSMDGIWSTLGYIGMAIGMVFFLTAILAYCPIHGAMSKTTIKEAAEDFSEQ